GLPPAERLQSLARGLAAGDLGTALEQATSLYHDGFAPRSLAERLTVTLRDALVNSLSGTGEFTLDLGQPELMRMIATLDEEQERFTRRDDLFSLEVALIKSLTALESPAEAPVATATAAAAKPLPEFDPLARPARREPVATR